MRSKRPTTVALVVLTALATAGLPLTAATADHTPENLVANPGFEAGTGSWYVTKNATLSRTSGHVGRYSARLTAAGIGPVVLNDGPDTVQATMGGATYTATVFVRSPNPQSPVTLQVKEYSGAVTHGRAFTRAVFTDRAWHRVTVEYTAKSSGARLGINVVADQLARGRSVDVDEVSLTAVKAPAIRSLTATPGTPDYAKVNVAWEASDAERYELYVGDATTPIYSGTATSYALDAAPRTTYSLTLRAIGHTGDVAASSSVTATTAAKAPTIQSFAAAPGTPADSKLDVTWAAADATRYELYVNGTATPIYVGTATSFTYDVVPDTTYSFTLRAVGHDDKVTVSAPVTATTTAKPVEWQRVYRHEFASLADVASMQSSPSVNDAVLPTDSTNDLLQKPTLRSNVDVVADSTAEDGKAMAVHTRRGYYQTSAGTKYGWTNGRMTLKNNNEAPPVRIRTRLKMTASVKVKAAVMWWPAGGGWPWEVDFAETFGGKTLTDYWGSRQYVGQRWHADLNGDGKAKEQLIHDDKVDATQFHVYDLFITPSRMWIEIDGRKTYETTDKRFIPTGAGFFTIGKALTDQRDSPGRTDDAVLVDWLEIYKLG